MSTDPYLIDQARDLWIAGEEVHAIGRAVGRDYWTIYNWRAKFGWPERRHRGRRGPIRDGTIVALAKKLWHEDLPRPDIAALCGVSVATVADWRLRYDWPKRQPGKCGLAAWEKVYRSRPRKPKEPDPMEQILRTIASRRQGSYIPHTRFRCCGQTVSALSCPACGRQNPMSAA